jgi:hypothetical protein
MKRYTQSEWAELIDDGRAAADRETGEDPQGWTVDGIHGLAMTPDDSDENDDVVFVAD